MPNNLHEVTAFFWAGTYSWPVCCKHLVRGTARRFGACFGNPSSSFPSGLSFYQLLPAKIPASSKICRVPSWKRGAVLPCVSLVLITLFLAWLDIPKCQAELLNGWSRFVPSSPRPSTFRKSSDRFLFLQFYNNHPQNKVQNSLKNAWAWRSDYGMQTKIGDWPLAIFFFFFSANEEMFLFSQAVLNNLSFFFLKQMHGL